MIWGDNMMYFVWLLLAIIGGIIKFIQYFQDEKREERGEPSQNREFMGSISDNHSMDFVEQWRSELENIKNMRENTEQEQRDKYNFSNRNANMDDLYSINKNNNDRQ